MSEPFPWLKGVPPTSDGSSSLTLPCLAAPNPLVADSAMRPAGPSLDTTITSVPTCGADHYSIFDVPCSHTASGSQAAEARTDTGVSDTSLESSHDCLQGNGGTAPVTLGACAKHGCSQSGAEGSESHSQDKHHSLEAFASSNGSRTAGPFTAKMDGAQSCAARPNPNRLLSFADVHDERPQGSNEVEGAATAPLGHPMDAWPSTNFSKTHERSTKGDVQATRAHVEWEYFRERAALGSLLSSGTSSGAGGEKHDVGGQGAHSNLTSPTSPGTFALPLTQPDDLSTVCSPSRANADLDRILRDSSFWKS
jgi:hypothetical protein